MRGRTEFSGVSPISDRRAAARVGDTARDRFGAASAVRAPGDGPHAERRAAGAAVLSSVASDRGKSRPLDKIDTGTSTFDQIHRLEKKNTAALFIGSWLHTSIVSYRSVVKIALLACCFLACCWTAATRECKVKDKNVSLGSWSVLERGWGPAD